MTRHAALGRRVVNGTSGGTYALPRSCPPGVRPILAAAQDGEVVRLRTLTEADALGSVPPL